MKGVRGRYKAELQLKSNSLTDRLSFMKPLKLVVTILIGLVFIVNCSIVDLAK
jgi:hypothetical protein